MLIPLNLQTHQLLRCLQNESEIARLLSTKSMGIEADQQTLRKACHREKLVDGIAIQKPFVTKQDTEKSVERAEGQLITHGYQKDQNITTYNMDEKGFIIGLASATKHHVIRSV